MRAGRVGYRPKVVGVVDTGGRGVRTCVHTRKWRTTIQGRGARIQINTSDTGWRGWGGGWSSKYILCA